jgi:hypothetical protein
MKDEVFRREMIANPKAVVEKEIGKINPQVHLKSHLNIKLIQQDPNELIIILPPNDPALSDEDLNNVAAGIASADIVMTGGGVGTNTTPFEFELENVTYA